MITITQPRWNDPPEPSRVRAWSLMAEKNARILKTKTPLSAGD